MQDEEVKPVQWIVEKLTETWGASWMLDGGEHPLEAHCLKLDCSKAKGSLDQKIAALVDEYADATAVRRQPDAPTVFRRQHLAHQR